MKFVDCSYDSMNTITKENYETYCDIFEKYQNLYHKLFKLKFNNNQLLKFQLKIFLVIFILLKRNLEINSIRHSQLWTILIGQDGP